MLTRRRLRVGPILWALIPALSFGLLAPVPFAHAAVRLHQRRMWAVTAAYAIGSLAWLVGVATPEGGWGDVLFTTVAFALMVVGTVHAFLLRGRVFAPLPPVPTALAADTDTHDGRPERPSPEDGKGVSPGWYQDPAGGPGGRHWDGSHWADRAAVPSTPPATASSPTLAIVFTLEIVLALLALFLAWIFIMGAASCENVENASRCFYIYGFAWVLLMALSSALLLGSGAMFIVGSRRKRDAVKRLAVWVLPIGTVAAWIMYVSIATIAFGT